jgi:hypothetical protein
MHILFHNVHNHEEVHVIYVCIAVGEPVIKKE